MNAAHLHLVLNHIPVIGIPLAAILLLYGMGQKNEGIKKAGVLAMVLLAMITVPSYLSGEPAEGVIENIAGVSKLSIEKHEEAAISAIIGTLILGLISLAGLLLFRSPKNLPGWLLATLLSFAILTTGMMAWTATLGGQIRHTELKSDNTNIKNNIGTESQNEKDDD